jgi:hypothetical protein
VKEGIIDGIRAGTLVLPFVVLLNHIHSLSSQISQNYSFWVGFVLLAFWTSALFWASLKSYSIFRKDRADYIIKNSKKYLISFWIIIFSLFLLILHSEKIANLITPKHTLWTELFVVLIPFFLVAVIGYRFSKFIGKGWEEPQGRTAYIKKQNKKFLLHFLIIVFLVVIWSVLFDGIAGWVIPSYKFVGVFIQFLILLFLLFVVWRRISYHFWKEWTELRQES